MFGEYIGRITLTVDLAEVYTLGPYGLLDPKCVCVSMCLSLPSPCREQIPIAALESVQTRKGSSTPTSLSSAWYPRPCPAPLITPANSASPELREMLVCVDDQCFMQCLPSITQPPEVDFLVSGQPAQSVSV